MRRFLALVLPLLVLLTACAHSATPAKAKPSAAPSIPKTPAAPPQPSFHYFSGPVYYQNEVVVLMLHDITPHPQPNSDEITPATFQGDLQLLQQDHYNVIPSSLLASFLEHKAQIPPNAVVLTFDDGYQGVYTYGFPLLQRYHVPATCFIITGFVHPRKPWTMTWSQIKQMYESGLVSIQSHTNDSHGAVQSGPGNTTGPALTDRIYDPSTGVYESRTNFLDRIRSDLALAKAKLQEHLPGDKVDMFAYPFGAYDQTVIQVLQQDGYRFAFTTWGGAATPHTNPFQIFRINVGTWKSTPQGLVNAARDMATAMSAHPQLQAPSRVVPTWH